MSSIESQLDNEANPMPWSWVVEAHKLDLPHEESTMCPVRTNREIWREAKRANVPNCHCGNFQLSLTLKKIVT